MGSTGDDVVLPDTLSFVSKSLLTFVGRTKNGLLNVKTLSKNKEKFRVLLFENLFDFYRQLLLRFLFFFDRSKEKKDTFSEPSWASTSQSKI